MLTVGLAIAGGLFLVAVAIGYFKQGTVKAAIETVELLKTQVESLKDELEKVRDENADLRSKYDALQEAVTQVAPVRELTELVKRQHAELVALLAHSHAQS